MDYQIIKGMEDPVKVRGFLLVHFYILLATGAFGSLLILGSVSTCLQAGSIAPLMQNTGMSILMMLTALIVLRHLSSRKKFPSMGKAVETSNVPLHRRLYPLQRGITLSLEDARSMKAIADRLADDGEIEEAPDSAEAEDITGYEELPRQHHEA